MNPTSLTLGPKAWDKKTVENTYSNFVERMHSLDLAVHPYTLKNDNLQYKSSAFAESLLFVDKGVDGVFTEFPETTFVLFKGLGNLKPAWPLQTPTIEPPSTTTEADGLR